MSTPGEEIAVAVRRTLAEEAQRNKYQVSIVRVFAYSLLLYAVCALVALDASAIHAAVPSTVGQLD